jgi:hypothetical protein
VETGADWGQNARMRYSPALVVGAGLVLGVSGCGSSATPGPAVDAAVTPSEGGGGPSPSDGGEDLFDPDADVFIPCSTDTRADHYMAGMQKTGPKGVTLTLVSSDPGPPIKGTNTWTILVADSGKMPQSGATLKVLPYMPDHKHGSPAKAVISPLTDPGQYKVTPLYLFMAGLWEVTFDVTTASGMQDAVVYRFCIEQ